MKFRALLLFTATFSVLCGMASSQEFDRPKIVVSITPFYGLVAAVMEGVATPELLVKAGASPHHYALKASEIQLLKEAQILFWGGPTLETFLIKPLQTRIKSPPLLKIVELDKTPGLFLLPVRQDPIWEPHRHLKQDSTKTDIDMHFWLDPKNALLITENIIHILSTLDPMHAARYQKNGKDLKIRLKKLDTHIASQLKEVKEVPYIVFHDAYQYFEHRYGLKGVGAITLHPEIPPSTKRLYTIRKIIEKTKARCVFSEPQFSPKLVESILEDFPVKRGELDPEGQEAQKNVNGYFELLENLSTAMKECLSNNLKPRS